MKTKTRKYVGIYNDEGSFVNFYRLKNRKTMAFKEFESKKLANEAYNNQKSLSIDNFAPKVYGKVMKIDIYEQDDNRYYRSGWGYITEIAETIECEDEDNENISNDRDSLIENLEKYHDMTFYDCHPLNYGYVWRKGSRVLVCIDTGNESFNGDYCY